MAISRFYLVCSIICLVIAEERGGGVEDEDRSDSPTDAYEI